MTPKEKLLTQALDYAATHGISDLSLRQLATAIGTSHRMLIYHFGSREGLLVALVKAVEQQQREVLASLELAPGAGLTDVGQAFWDHLSDPELWPRIRLFYELYGQALQGRPGTTELLDGIISDWLEPVTELLTRHGMPRARARAHARLGLAISRGLLLDLVTTHDRAGVDDAMAVYTEMFTLSVGTNGL
jgi:AcrR family transcriptional regulator